MKMIPVAQRPVRLRTAPALLVLCCASARSASDESTMVVSAAPGGLSELDTPAAVSVAYGDDIRRAAPRVNLSENLSGLPGLQIQNRQNYAQDLQISIRGFGSRSTYGVRGMRIWLDGIPATMPDGRGRRQYRSELCRSGGSAAWAVFRALRQRLRRRDQYRDPERRTARQRRGKQLLRQFRQLALWAKGAGRHRRRRSGGRRRLYGFRHPLQYTWLSRPQQRAQNLGNARLGVRIDDVSTLTLLFNSVDIKAQDPGGNPR